jgi:hypothetical protein
MPRDMAYDKVVPIERQDLNAAVSLSDHSCLVIVLR